MHLLYYFMDFISVTGTCKDSLASALHSDLMSKFPESLWATVYKTSVLWVQKGDLAVVQLLNFSLTLYRYVLIYSLIYLFMCFFILYSFVYLLIL